YYPSALELLNKIQEKKILFSQNKALALAVEYLKIGEFKYGMYLLDSFAKVSKYSEKDLYELYIAAGDIANYTYLYMYYTRVLMKLFFVPDDPLLLPQEITKRLYPRPYRELVIQATKEFGIEEEIIYAVMRQESFFRENARSPANARGLMQVMPKTGQHLAAKLNIHRYSLHDPEVSIRMGAKFLADLLKNYEGKLTWAAIAYNGGPGNLRKWKRNHYKGDFNHFLEEIPAKESRDYCRVILSNYRNYKLLTIKENWN
ncbi:MAG: lytic transglycosylase domain-containing protein, partial [Leptospiraceae bacterium]|nr:lytic transglycosylase domain-containing protein [Leptospiraceae bacterium]